MVLVWLSGSLFLAYKLFRRQKGQDASKRLLYLVLLIEILFVPVCLLFQCKRPYYRVFTYAGVLLSLLLGVLLEAAGGALLARLPNKKGKAAVCIAGMVLALSFGVKCLGFSGYNEQYGTREYEIAQAWAQADVTEQENLCVTDCNQEYLLYFLYGIRCENREIEGADVLLLDKRMMQPWDEMVWEFYHYYETIPWEYVNQNMTRAYENNDYVLFLRR